MLAQTAFIQGENYFNAGKYEQAKTTFENVLKDYPNDLKTLEYLGDIACFFKNWDAALPYYEKLKKTKPSKADFYYKYGGALGMKAKESNKFKALSLISAVIASFETTISLNSKHIGARWALIEVYLQLPGIVGGSEKKAILYSNELLKIVPVEGYLSRGHIEEYFKRYSNAEKQYKKAIAVNNSQSNIQKLANLYKDKMNQPEKAKQLVEGFYKKNKT